MEHVHNSGVISLKLPITFDVPYYTVSISTHGSGVCGDFAVSKSTVLPDLKYSTCNYMLHIIFDSGKLRPYGTGLFLLFYTSVIILDNTST